MTRSSELLVAAADRIRDLAAAASPGPWQDNGYGMLVAPEVDWREPGYDVAAGTSEANRQWVAALSPAVAPHLEAWLRMAAEDYERRAPLPKVGDPNPRSLPVDLTGAFGPTYWSEALALAKLICPELEAGSQ